MLDILMPRSNIQVHIDQINEHITEKIGVQYSVTMAISREKYGS